jgi:hypothetical protein
MIGACQFQRAIGDPLLKSRVGFLKLLIQDNVVEGDRQPAGEEFNKRAVGSRQLAGCFQQHHDFPSAAGLDVENRSTSGKVVTPTLERLFHQPSQFVF